MFFELNFVIIEENICQITTGVKKSALTSSSLYQRLPKWLMLRNLLLTGSIDNLYNELLKD